MTAKATSTEIDELVRLSADGIVVADREGVVLFANPAARALLGRGSSDAVGFHLGIPLVGAEGTVVTIPRAGGEVSFVELRAAEIAWQGEPAFVLNLRDVTALKTAEEELAERERRFRLLAESIEDVFWIAAPGTTENLYLSPAYQKVWGRSLDESQRDSRAFLEAVHPDDKQRVVAAVNEAHGAGRPYSLEYRIVRPDGEVRWIHERGFLAATSPDGAPLMAGVSIDVTERKRAERTVEGLLEVTRAVLDYHDLETTAHEVLRVSKQLTGATAGYVALRKGHDESDVLVMDTGGADCTVDPLLGMMPVRGPQAESYRLRLPVFDNDLLGSSLAKRLPEGHAPLRNVMFVPVMLDGETKGIVGLANKVGEFTEEDAGRGQALGELMAIALRRHLHIEELVARERDAREQRDFAETLVSTAQTIILVLDPQGRINTFNSYLEDLSGYTLNEVRGRDWIDTFLPARTRTRTRELLARAIAGEAIRPRIDVMLTRSGHEFLVEWNNKALRLANGTVAGLLLTGHDVTERQRSREELQDSERRFRLVFESTTDGLLVIDAQTRRPIAANNGFCRLVGYSVEELRQRTIADLHPPETLPEIEQALATMSTGESSFREAVYVKRRDGSVFEADIGGAATTEYDGRDVFVASFRDVTEVRKLRASVAQSDRLASMGMLAAGVAHEINNPLSYILYNLESLSRDIPTYASKLRQLYMTLVDHLGEEQARQILADGQDLLSSGVWNDVADRFADALSGTRRIKDIARGLGTFSRVHQDQVVPVSLTQVIEVAINMAFNEIKYRARLVKDFAKVPVILASEGRLAQVFLNLLINATHAIDEGNVADNEIRVRTWSEGDSVFAEVRDTGCGIPPENLEKLFEPFFTTKKVGVGSGLGLSISRNIVERYGGAINVESRVGEGTSFIIRLPVKPVETTAAGQSSPETGLAASHRGRLLIVDDEAALRSAMARMLSGHDIVLAASGAEARSILEKDQAFDLIVCDMMMSDISGMELHEWLVVNHPLLAKQFVFMTGGAFTPRARDYLSSVDNIRLEKPFDIANFKKIVSELVQTAKKS